MHIPDGFLDARTCAGTYCFAAAGLVWAGRQVAARLTDRTVPVLGVMSAFVFAGQMVNFPVMGGTSGHLLGGVLAGVLLGPAAASMVLALVLFVQCLFFQDGGLTALGANVLNLGLLGVWGGYAVYRLAGGGRSGPRRLLVAASLGAWSSVVLASAGCALQLAASGTAPLRLVLPAMVLTHAAIGLGEAAITAAVLSFVHKVRPDLIHQPAGLAGGSQPLKAVLVTGSLLTLGVVILLVPFASSAPDGLERLASELGFASQGRAAVATPLADYTVPGVMWDELGAVLAGLLGIAVLLGLAWGVARFAGRSPRRSDPRAPGA